MKEVHLLSGVVRNRKMATPHHRHSKIRDEGDDGGGQHGPRTFIARVWGYVPGNRILANIKIRAFKFEFKWDVFVFIMIAMLSLVPFFFTGSRWASVLPMSVWAIYHLLFAIGTSFGSIISGETG